MTDHAWIITRDYIHESIPLERWGKDFVEVRLCGPSTATSAALKKAEKEGRAFRIYDDDGILYYTGRCYSPVNDERLFSPLDDYGTPGAGATEIRYINPGTHKWETL